MVITFVVSILLFEIDLFAYTFTMNLCFYFVEGTDTSAAEPSNAVPTTPVPSNVGNTINPSTPNQFSGNGMYINVVVSGLAAYICSTFCVEYLHNLLFSYI